MSLCCCSVCEQLTSVSAPAQVSHDKFFWTAPLAAMAVTSTAKGIAPKFLLLGTAAGQVQRMTSAFGCSACFCGEYLASAAVALLSRVVVHIRRGERPHHLDTDFVKLYAGATPAA